MAIKKLSEGSIMSKFIQNFVRDERGITAIEYALIAGLISIALVTIVGTLTTGLGTAFTNIALALTSHS
jgi:pilus assembly protein Flp/PilA